MSWDSYIAQITNVYDYAAGAYTATGVAQFGAIYGLDGSKWGSSEGFDLTSYDYEIDDGTGTTKKIAIDESAILKAVLSGDDKGGEAGIRIGKEKFMLTGRDGDRINLSKKAGGLIIGKAKTCAVLGVWTSAQKDSNGKFQNPGDVWARVKAMVDYLTSQGY